MCYSVLFFKPIFCGHLFMATISMSNDTVIKSNDYTFIIHSFDNILRFSHSTFSYKDDPDLLHQTALTSTLPIAADSCFGGAFTFRRSICISEEGSCLGGEFVFRRSWKKAWEKLFVSRRNLDFDYSFGKNIYILVLCLSISH